MMLPATTPVLVGAAQYTERLSDPNYQAMSPTTITAVAAKRALADAADQRLVAHIDSIYTVRTFEDSTPTLAFPFGCALNFPRAVCAKLGLTPLQAVWGSSGGNTPQELVAEACENIARGESSAAVVCGGEAMSTAMAHVSAGREVDWHDDTDGTVDDRGAAIDYIHPAELRHGLVTPPLFHGLIENAARAKAGKSVVEWQQAMAELFAPLSKVASDNPFGVQSAPYGVQELLMLGEGNRLIAHPYPQRLIAKDKVNQSAAVVIVSKVLADTLDIAADQRVYLHGCATAKEPLLCEREDVSAAPSAGRALHRALALAECDVAGLDALDLYSCFPIAVSNALAMLQLPRAFAGAELPPITLTGGLPFFGGPGNNYSLHAIVEAVHQLRATATQRILVGANGGFLSKYAAGVYSSLPRPFSVCDDTEAQSRSTREPLFQPDATYDAFVGQIETYTVNYNRDGYAKSAIALLREAATGRRLIARTAKGDAVTAAAVASTDPLAATAAVMVDHSKGEPMNIFVLGLGA